MLSAEFMLLVQLTSIYWHCLSPIYQKQCSDTCCCFNVVVQLVKQNETHTL